MRKQNVALTAFLLFSFVMVILLTWGITYGLKHGPRMDEPPVGAGAGATGGANAFGELLAGHAANTSAAEKELVDPTTLEQGFILLVRDKAKRSSASDPIYFASSVNGWNPNDPAFKLTIQSDTKWLIHLVKPSNERNPSRPIEFKFVRGSMDRREVNADLLDVGNRTLPRINASKLRAGEIPTIELTIERWADERPNAKPAGEMGRP